VRPAVPFLELRTRYRRLKPEIDRAIQEVLDHGLFVLGPQVGTFEAEFAAYLGVPHAVAVSSGTDALRLALLAAGVGPGDEVVTSAFTAVGTVVAIEGAGARAVLVDIDPPTYTLDVHQIEARLSARTRAIVPVHLYGQPADLHSLMAIATRRGLAVVEDACQAHGATYHGRKAGSVGLFGCFSFYPTKNLAGYGDGGMVVTSSADHAERLRLLRNYGERDRFAHHLRGFNCRLDELQAAVLRVKLRHLDGWNGDRRRLAHRYKTGLEGTGVAVPVERQGGMHVYCSYVIRHPARDRLREWLAERGIGTSVQYPWPIHLQPAYRDLGVGPGSFPAAERAAAEVVSLPIFPELDEDAIDAVCDAIRAFAASPEVSRAAH
jgi:dTDP-4-amino-4,6-dideoxygalactose transaminase